MLGRLEKGVKLMVQLPVMEPNQDQKRYGSQQIRDKIGSDLKGFEPNLSPILKHHNMLLEPSNVIP